MLDKITKKDSFYDQSLTADYSRIFEFKSWWNKQ